MVALDIFTARLSTFHVPSPPGNRAQHTKQGKERQIQTRREREQTEGMQQQQQQELVILHQVTSASNNGDFRGVQVTKGK